jgi:hypothetical protein
MTGHLSATCSGFGIITESADEPIRNRNTRAARAFLAWCEERGLGRLAGCPTHARRPCRHNTRHRQSNSTWPVPPELAASGVTHSLL